MDGSEQFNNERTTSELSDLVHYRYLTASDIASISKAFDEVNWPKPASLFEQYLKEVEAGQRLIWVALFNNHFAGYVTLKWQSLYPPFKEQNIPEIIDLNVLPAFRKKGIGSKLLELAETTAAHFIGVLYLTYQLFIGIINNPSETDIEFTSCRQILNPSTV